MKERKEELVKQYNELTAKITELTQIRLKVLGAVELIEEMEEEEKPVKEKK
tara:strand:+ start:5200 stop:5352 length:153 start_codon:yes stop_codon:yes gene_type:complete